MAPNRPEPPFEHALVAVCGECSGRDPRPKAVRTAIREALRAAGGKRSARVVETSCLDLCPKKAVAVAVARRSGAAMSCHVVSDDDDLRRLITRLSSEVAPRS